MVGPLPTLWLLEYLHRPSLGGYLYPGTPWQASVTPPAVYSVPGHCVAVRNRLKKAMGERREAIGDRR
jgi:hypothetical protein